MKMCNLLTLGDHGVKTQANLEMKILPGLLGGSDKPQESSDDRKRKNTFSAASPEEDDNAGAEGLSNTTKTKKSLSQPDSTSRDSVTPGATSQSEDVKSDASVINFEIDDSFIDDVKSDSSGSFIAFEEEDSAKISHLNVTSTGASLQSRDDGDVVQAGSTVTPETIVQPADSLNKSDNGPQGDSIGNSQAKSTAVESPEDIGRIDQVDSTVTPIVSSTFENLLNNNGFTSFGNDNDNMSDLNNISEEKANYFRLLIALQEVMLKSVPCVEVAVKQWHDVAKCLIGSCKSPKVCCKCKGKRPQEKQGGRLCDICKQMAGSCDICITWADGVENAIYAGATEIKWANLQVSELSSNPLQIAKAFIFKTPKDRLDKITSFDKCDAGSVLLIMMNFAPFLVSQERSEQIKQIKIQGRENHWKALDQLKKLNPQPNPGPKDAKKLKEMADIIDKIYKDVRCVLDHYPLVKQLHMESKQMEEKLQHLETFVNCMKDLKHLTEEDANTLGEKLKEIPSMPVNQGMIEKVKHAVTNQLLHIEGLFGRNNTLNFNKCHFSVSQNGINHERDCKLQQISNTNTEELQQGADAMTSDMAFCRLKYKLMDYISDQDAKKMKTFLRTG
ncbi:uncharacterized protein [Amphiura filiformis]|uniref:uncharacterized protein n=1 Tax=Amphiura filiformis TaxID=82378 RepID=UPI003B221BFD